MRLSRLGEDILTNYHPRLPSVWLPPIPTCSQPAGVRGRAPGRVHFGRTVTGEAFITDEGRAEINARFAPLTVDMETAAMAHVCYETAFPLQPSAP